MEPLCFYDVDKEYIHYIQEAEIAAHGVSHVPYINYVEAGRRQKFFCGIVLQINDMNYYVPVSSTIKDNPGTFYLCAEDGRRTSSLRFTFMFPVPTACCAIRWLERETVPEYQALMKAEILWCRQHEAEIREIARQTYVEIFSGLNPELAEKSCDFPLLEASCRQYCLEHDLSLGQSQAANLLPPSPLLALCRRAQDLSKAQNDLHRSANPLMKNAKERDE